MNKEQFETQAEILKTKFECYVLYGRVIMTGNELSYFAIDRIVNQTLDAMLEDINNYTKNSSFKQIVNIFKRDEDERYSKADRDYINRAVTHIANVAECLFDTYITLSTR